MHGTISTFHPSQIGAVAVVRALSFALCTGLAAAAPPVVTTVEPPNWWAGHSINPVRLLIRGENLKGARVRSSLPIGRVAASTTGTYLFVDVNVGNRAKPGEYPIEIVTTGGTARASFAITPELSPTNRFQGFGPDDVLYLIMPDRFANGDPSNDHSSKSPGLFDRSNPRFYHGGDLQGVIDKLPYLRDLGITAVWLNPVYDNNDRVSMRRQPFTDYHGYGPIDFYAVDERLGDVAKLRELVDKAHQIGVKIILDQVANHCGPFHPWVNDPPTPTWFNGTRDKHLVNRFQAWTLMDPYATPSNRRETLEGWFVNLLPDLNQNDEEVRRYLTQNSLWWIGMTGLDGIRQDTVPYVPRTFWSHWMSAIRRQYPRLRVLGEVFERDPALVSFFQGGRPQAGIDTKIDTLFDFPLYFAIRHAFTQRAGGVLRELPKTLAHDWLYPDPSVLVTHLGLHDVPRFMSEQGATPAALKLAFTFLMTTRGTPLIYYGDEIGMQGGADPDNRRDFPGGWPDDPRNAFIPEGRTPSENDIWQHVRTLAHLRAGVLDLRRGPLRHLLTDEHHYVYQQGRVIVALSNSTEPAVLAFPLDGASTVADALGSGARLEIRDGHASLQLAPRSGAVFIP